MRLALLKALPAAALLVALAPTGTAPADAAAATAAAPHLVSYPGHGVDVWRASGQIGRLHATSPAFRAFVRHRLDRAFHALGRPACSQAPVITVKRYESDGFAFISNEGIFPGGPGHAPDRCADGGHAALFAVRGGRWRAVITGQEEFACAELHRYDVPAAVAPHMCLDAQGHSVAYSIA